MGYFIFLDGFYFEFDFRKVYCLEISQKAFDFNSKWFFVVIKIDGVKKKSEIFWLK